MKSILVVCTGNICRSPVAEGFLRDALRVRFGAAAPRVSSAGTSGWEGAGAMPESVRAAAERGTDISGHEARLLTDDMIDEADLVVCLATEHRESVAERGAIARAKAFTLKELVRTLEYLPAVAPGNDPDTLLRRVARADNVRRNPPAGNLRDQDVADPFWKPIESYRAMA